MEKYGVEKKKPPVKGVKVRNLNLVMILLSCILYVALLIITRQAASDYDHMVQTTSLYIDCQEDASMVSSGSDYLTEQVRLFVVTLDTSYVDNYFHETNVTRRRETALEHLDPQASPRALSYLETALDYSNQLMEREIYAMRLAAQSQGIDPADLAPEVEAVSLSQLDETKDSEAQLEEARDLVFGSEYQAKKQLITSNIGYFLSDVIASTQSAQQASLNDLNRTMFTERVLFSILFVQNVLIFMMIIFLIVKPLQVYVNCIKEEKRMEITGAYEFKYLALTYNDIYEINAANEVLLRHQAEHDPLTGLINRGAFDQVKAVLKVKAPPIALLIIDVDKFKLINDGYGHETGDAVLKKVAHLLEESFRATDFPARIGGDEFAVIVTEIDSRQQKMVEAKIKAINDSLLSPMDGLPSVSLSVGGAFSATGYSDELYGQADAALYQVKEHGRCGCRFYEKGMTAGVPQKKVVEPAGER